MRLTDIATAMNIAWYGFSVIALAAATAVLLRTRNDPAQQKLRMEALIVIGVVLMFCLLPYAISFIRK